MVLGGFVLLCLFCRAFFYIALLGAFPRGIVWNGSVSTLKGSWIEPSTASPRSMAAAPFRDFTAGTRVYRSW